MRHNFIAGQFFYIDLKFLPYGYMEGFALLSLVATNLNHFVEQGVLNERRFKRLFCESFAVIS